VSTGLIKALPLHDTIRYEFTFAKNYNYYTIDIRELSSPRVD